MLTAKQWAGWEAFWEAEPWGDWREDARSEAYQLRLLTRFSGEGKMPSGLWPYFSGDDDVAELVEAGKNTEANLVPKEGGGYEWRQPLPS